VERPDRGKAARPSGLAMTPGGVFLGATTRPPRVGAADAPDTRLGNFAMGAGAVGFLDVESSRGGCGPRRSVAAPNKSLAQDSKTLLKVAVMRPASCISPLPFVAFCGTNPSARQKQTHLKGWPASFMSSKSADPTDKHVGTRVRMRRGMLGLSQSKLADALGISFQQVQKYENGTNRIGAGRLQQLAHFLQVPVPLFFEGLPLPSETSSEDHAYVADFLATSDGLSLIKNFMRIKDAKLRRRIVDLVEQIAGRYN
jgi:transcriptional regulator with XRE-family HTH domain